MSFLASVRNLSHLGIVRRFYSSMSPGGHWPSHERRCLSEGTLNRSVARMVRAANDVLLKEVGPSVEEVIGSSIPFMDVFNSLLQKELQNCVRGQSQLFREYGFTVCGKGALIEKAICQLSLTDQTQDKMKRIFDSIELNISYPKRQIICEAKVIKKQW